MQHQTMSCEEVHALLAQGAQLVDVRSAYEHQQQPLQGAINIPLPVIQQALKQLDKSAPVLLYCASGHRSGTAKRVLEACGFTRVHNVGSHTFLNTCKQD